MSGELTETGNNIDQSNCAGYYCAFIFAALKFLFDTQE